MDAPISLQQSRAGYEAAAAGKTPIDSASEKFLCSTCPAYELSICAAICRNTGSSERRHGAAPFVATIHKVPARRTIWYANEWSDHVPIICQGWAMTSLTLSDGRRQILSFLLPGDMFSSASLFEKASGRSIEAVTDVTYRCYNRSDFKAILFEYPDVLETLTRAWIDEKSRADQLAVDLGRRTADERIARLILNLRDRMNMRGMAQDQVMDFPLRQHHIADATGLTPVHVNKVLSEFRRAGLIEINNRSLTILDQEEFRRVANMR